MRKRPLIALTMGDPSGNGPELTVKALDSARHSIEATVVVIGDLTVLENAKRIVKSDIVLKAIKSPAEADESAVNVIDLAIFKDISSLRIGQVDATSGLCAFLAVKKAIELAMAGEVDATVTNALNKEAMNLALEKSGGAYSDGMTHFDGHTEIYAHYTGTRSYCMMLMHHDFRVSHVSTHCALREACDRVRKNRVLEVTRLTHNALRDMGIARPHIAVAGLNPHAGEHGLFGREEIDEIIPAIEEAKAEGIDATGPVPPDSVFSEALGGLYDAVVAMYHDQGHIPVKTVGFVYDRQKGKWKALEGVNVTLGLPIIRTSVDHGTGFALAGSGQSDESSLVNAIDAAIAFAAGRMKA